MTTRRLNANQMVPVTVERDGKQIPLSLSHAGQRQERQIST